MDIKYIYTVFNIPYHASQVTLCVMFNKNLIKK